MASSSKNTAPAPGKQLTTEDRTDPGHGFMYQTKLLMLFVHRGLRAGHTFRLATELKSAKKFDDLVYEYTVDEKKIYRLLQAKHKLNNRKDEMIRTDSLLTESAGDFSLVKYFFSYREMKAEKLFKEAEIQDVIVFTNIDFDIGDLTKNNITLKSIDQIDIILSMSSDLKLSRTSSLYRFGSETIPALMKNVESFHLTKLARQLVKCLLKHEVIKHHEEPFKLYHMILAKEVFHIPTNKFQCDFLAEASPEDQICPLKENTFRFRTIFKEVFEKETDHKIKVEDLNKAIDAGQVVKSTKIGLKFSKNFGNRAARKTKKDSSENALPEEEGWPTNAISSEEIKDFFDHLIFAVNQPNEDELGDIVRTEVGEGYDEEWTESVYGKFKIKMEKLIQGKEKSKFSPSSEWKKFFDEEKEKRRPILFDIQDPVSTFTGREKQLNSLHEMLLKSESTAISQRASVSGLGGIGKSELVKKYISMHRSHFGNRVIWLNAESRAKLSESFKRLASERLGISLTNSHDKSPKHIKSIVEDVYTYFSAAKSLFIFDNADDNLGVDGIKEFSPCSSLPHKPHVLITSRNCQWGPIPVISLDILTNQEAMELIKKALNIESDAQDNEIQRLAETLQFFPLALQQALAYINVTDAQLKNIGKKFDITAYLKRFEKETKKLLDFKFPNEGDDTYTKTTFTTWNITIEKISKYPEIGDVTIEILNRMAFLGSDDIPTEMFLPMCDNEEVIGSAVQLLKQFSIVCSGKVPVFLNIHRLVQLVTRLSLSDRDGTDGTLFEACRLCLSFVSEIARANEYSSRRTFVSHLEKILSNLDECRPGKAGDKNIELDSMVRLLSAMGKEYYALGDYRRAVVLQERELKIREYHYGSEHFQLTKTLFFLGVTWSELGDHIKAKESLERALGIQEGHYGPDHVKLGDTLFKVGITFMGLGEFAKAKESLERALKIKESHYGSEHFEVADTLYTMGVTLTQLGEFAKAKECLERAVGIKENHYGPEHVEIADVLCKLAFTLRELGEFTKAKELLERALRIKESHCGSENAEVADILCSFAMTLRDLGDLTKAKASLERALRIRETNYGSDHVQVADTLFNLGFTLRKLGELTNSKELLERALRIKETHCGSDHVQVADILCSLTDTLRELGEFTKAKELIERALKIKETHYGPDHMQVANTLFYLSVNLTALGELTKAKESLERALTIKEKHCGPNHIQVAGSLFSLAFSLRKLGEFAKAKELLERALRIRETYFGSHHVQVADTLKTLADTLIAMGEFTKAKELLEQAFITTESNYGSDHIKVAFVLNSLSVTLMTLGDYTKAKESLEWVLRIQESHYGCEHVEVADTLCRLALTLSELGEPTKAKESLERALRIKKKHYGSEHNS